MHTLCIDEPVLFLYWQFILILYRFTSVLPKLASRANMSRIIVIPSIVYYMLFSLKRAILLLLSLAE